MDLLLAKSRVAKALVESIFRRARYQVRPFRPDQLPLRFGRESFSPDFSVALQSDDGTERVFLVEVKYRPSVEQFISVENQRGERSVFLLARRHWPMLYFVFVTDHPAPGRSCFQAMSLSSYRAGEPFRTADLVELKDVGIFQHNIEDHEELGRRIFDLLSEA